MFSLDLWGEGSDLLLCAKEGGLSLATGLVLALLPNSRSLLTACAWVLGQEEDGQILVHKGCTGWGLCPGPKPAEVSYSTASAFLPLLAQVLETSLLLFPPSFSVFLLPLCTPPSFSVRSYSVSLDQLLITSKPYSLGAQNVLLGPQLPIFWVPGR